jgi:hypothetical protein
MTEPSQKIRGRVEVLRPHTVYKLSKGQRMYYSRRSSHNPEGKYFGHILVGDNCDGYMGYGQVIGAYHEVHPETSAGTIVFVDEVRVPTPKCPYCQSIWTIAGGRYRLKTGTLRQVYNCKGCGKNWTPDRGKALPGQGKRRRKSKRHAGQARRK